MPKICGSFRALQFSFNQLVMVAIIPSSHSLAPVGQFLMQAQQRMHAPISVATLSPTEMAAVGHTLAQVPHTLAVPGDVASASDMEAAFARVHSAWGTPGILVNCAGVLGPARVFQRDKATGRTVPRPMESFRRVIAINLTGTFNTIRLFAQGLAQAGPADDGQERGVIVNTASVAAYDGQIV